MQFYPAFFRTYEETNFSDVVSWDVVDPKYEIRTGDVLLFSASSLVSTILKTFTLSNWSHAGMVCWVKLKFSDGSSKIELFCFELGSQHHTDLMSGNAPDKEVRLVKFSDIAPMYDLVAVRQLNVKRPKDFPSKFKKFMLDTQGIPFIKSVFGLLKTFAFKPGAPDGELTCSALVAEMLEKLGLHNHGMETTQITPWHYTHESKAFPSSIFKQKEIVLYKNNRYVIARIIFITVIIILLLVILILILRRNWRKSNPNGKPNTNSRQNQILTQCKTKY